MEEKLNKLLSAVSPLDESAMEKARERQAQLAKPPGSLGRLEDLSVQLAGITGRVHNKMEKTHLLVFAADNGVVAEGVSSAPQSVTLMQTVNLTRAKTGASVLAKHFGSGITVCDVGVNADIREKAVLNRKIAYGTQNIASGPAMTREQAVTAILTGAKLAAETDKLDENSTAKRDGRAMQLGKGLDIDAAQAEKKADQKFRRQLTFSILAVICLAAAIVCGALMQR